MSDIVTFVLVFVVCFVIGMGRTGPRLIEELWYHHPGNHRCKRVGCCR